MDDWLWLLLLLPLLLLLLLLLLLRSLASSRLQIRRPRGFNQRNHLLGRLQRGGWLLLLLLLLSKTLLP